VEDLQSLVVRAVAAIAAAVLFEWALRRLGRRLPLVLTRRFVSRGASHPDPAIHRVVGLAILPLEVALWIGVAWYVTERLPALHDARDMTVRGVAMAFTVPLFTMGDRGYALRDLVALPVVLAVAWGVVGALTRVVESRVLGAGTNDHAGRETLGMLLRYALMLLVTLIVLQAWGIDVRTLAIAGSVLGVGIGFGLQNLANNFVSGIVISLERPIKPGDYVRVGEFQGTVQRIGARSTEILTNERVSILVPNSKLLEQEVVSWTHGDPTCRITVKVSAASGCDVARVRGVLLDAARGEPRVLPDPPPDVALAGFGESGLDFDLKVWIREPRRQRNIAADLNERIEAAFRQNGIDMPSPQRDLRLGSPELVELVAALTQRHFSADEIVAARRGIADARAAACAAAGDGRRVQSDAPGWSDEALARLVERMRGPSGLAIGDRRHRLRVYPRCFVGSDAVGWLVRHEGLRREQAVAVGELLVERNLLHHVLDEHTFHDDALFYRFRADD
jgi:potassium-dependent mechanosensitive channel